jgi:3-phosphoshikimate 1-carboxyvinyltransferase
MPNAVTIRRPERPIGARIILPRSKSLANRALILAALAGDLSFVTDPGEADDTRTLLKLLMERPRAMHCGDGGTTFRFLIAWACVQEGEEHLLTGSARSMERPHAPLIGALNKLGADIMRTETGYRVHGKHMRGGAITLDSPMSSQFISALLLIAPHFEEGLELHWTGRKLSVPYVEMTIAMLRHFGVDARVEEDDIHVPASPLRPASYEVPADWSAAAFWLETMAIAGGGTLELPGLHSGTGQGDERAVDHWSALLRVEEDASGTIVRPLSVQRGDRHFDLQDTPDLFQPLALTRAGLGLSAIFSGLHNLALKETDRLQAVADALRDLGCAAHFDQGLFTINGSITGTTPPPFDPRGDHRMAMSLAPLALVCGQITILHPEVVAKSYPGFWEDLRSAGFPVEFGKKANRHGATGQR